jgi:hypothetical protein
MWRTSASLGSEGGEHGNRYVIQPKKTVANEVALDSPGLLMEAATKLTRFAIGLPVNAAHPSLEQFFEPNSPPRAVD